MGCRGIGEESRLELRKEKLCEGKIKKKDKMGQESRKERTGNKGAKGKVLRITGG